MIRVVRLVVIDWRIGFVPSCENATLSNWNKILLACTQLHGIPNDERLEVIRVRFPLNREFQLLDKKFRYVVNIRGENEVDLRWATRRQNCYEVLLRLIMPKWF